jgi:hypothetical protein
MSVKAAERAAERAERAANAARAALGVRDGRLMRMLPTNDPRRVEYERAAAAALAAEREAAEARKHVESMRRTKPDATHARATLKGAISVARRAATAALSNQQAIERSSVMISDAEGKLESATAATAKARERASVGAEKAARTGKPIALDDAIHDAMRNEQTAHALLDALQRALANLQAKQPDLDAAHERAQQTVLAAVDDVLRAELPVQHILQEATTLQEQLTAKRLQLRRVLHESLIVDQQQQKAVAALFAHQLPGKVGDVQYQDWEKHPTTQRWRAMREALAHDADAPLDF